MFDQLTPLPTLTRVIISPTEGYHRIHKTAYCPFKVCIDGELLRTSELIPEPFWHGRPNSRQLTTDIFWLGQYYKFSAQQLPDNLPGQLRSVLLGQRPKLVEVAGDWRRDADGKWTRSPLFARVPLRSVETPQPLTVYVEEVRLDWALIRVDLDGEEAASDARESPGWQTVSPANQGQIQGPSETQVLVVQPAVRGLAHFKGQLLSHAADPRDVVAKHFAKMDQAELVRLWQNSTMDYALTQLGLPTDGVTRSAADFHRRFWLPMDVHFIAAPPVDISAAAFALPQVGQVLQYKGAPTDQVHARFFQDPQAVPF